ncbi:MAG: HEAT repeat protein [Planctomycetota bacterium]|jgi:HEAT repeat protein
MTFPAATHQPFRAAHIRCCGLLALLLLGASACGTAANTYTPGEITKEQKARCRVVAQAFVDSKPEYPALREELREDPVAMAWFVRYLVSEIVHAREGQAEKLGEKKVRIDRVKEATKGRDTPAEWHLPGQHADSRAVGQVIAIGEQAVDVVVHDLVLKPQEFLRAIGVELLTGIGDPAVPALLELASTGDQQQQRVAARALGELGAVGPSFEALKQLARSPVWRIRSDAAKGLASGGPEARDFLIGMLQDEDPFVRRKAGEALARYKDRIAATALIDFLESCKGSKDLTGELAAQKALQAIAGTRGPRSASAWRRFVDEMPSGEDER